MDNMNTFSGKRFNPMQMNLKDICTEDIAHALSMLCRGGGHLKYFYSVGQHSLNCMKEAKARGLSKRVQLACLLHDASETYIADIIRPIKQHLNDYFQVESMIMDCIWKKYGLEDLTEDEHNQWKQIDDDMLAYELQYLMNGKFDGDIPILYSVPDISEMKWEIVQNHFIETVTELKGLK